MAALKPFFISGFVALLLAAAGLGLWLGLHGAGNGWAVLAAAAVPLSFFAWLYLAKPARTGARPWWLMLGGVIGLSVLDTTAPDQGRALWLIALCGFVGPQLYVQWYSFFPPRDAGRLADGAVLPALSLYRPDGTPLTITEFFPGRTLWLFYRGNWCPLCVAQVKELAAQYGALAARGVRMVMVSPQPAAASAALAAAVDAPLIFVQDRDNALARALGIVDEHGLPLGLTLLGYDEAVPMPTVLISDGGKVVWRHLTDNYRLRPEPAVFLEALDALDGKPS